MLFPSDLLFLHLRMEKPKDREKEQDEGAGKTLDDLRRVTLASHGLDTLTHTLTHSWHSNLTVATKFAPSRLRHQISNLSGEEAESPGRGSNLPKVTQHRARGASGLLLPSTRTRVAVDAGPHTGWAPERILILP